MKINSFRSSNFVGNPMFSANKQAARRGNERLPRKIVSCDLQAIFLSKGIFHLPFEWKVSEAFHSLLNTGRAAFFRKIEPPEVLSVR